MPRSSVGLGVMAIRVTSSLVQHDDATVLGQVAVALKRDELSAVWSLLVGRDLSGKVVILDALHTLRSTARQIRAHNGHYLMSVKKNQAALYEYLNTLFRLPAHPADHEVWDTFGPISEKGHGRLEARRLICRNAHIEDVDWPDVQQVVRRECERIVLKSGKRSREVMYAMVSLLPAEAEQQPSNGCGAAIGRLRIRHITCGMSHLAKMLGMRHREIPRTCLPHCVMVCSRCSGAPTGARYPMRSRIMVPQSLARLRSLA
jgi:hypothetical protein